MHVCTVINVMLIGHLANRIASFMGQFINGLYLDIHVQQNSNIYSLRCGINKCCQWVSQVQQSRLGIKPGVEQFHVYTVQNRQNMGSQLSVY